MSASARSTACLVCTPEGSFAKRARKRASARYRPAPSLAHESTLNVWPGGERAARHPNRRFGPTLPRALPSGIARGMHDIRLIRENPQGFDNALARRGVAPQSAAILSLDTARRDTATRMQEAQARRNEASKAIGAAMGKGDAATADALKAEVAELETALPGAGRRRAPPHRRAQRCARRPPQPARRRRSAGRG